MISYYGKKVKRKTYLKPILLKFIVTIELFMATVNSHGCFYVEKSSENTAASWHQTETSYSNRYVWEICQWVKV